jgi:hypothetical protein
MLKHFHINLLNITRNRNLFYSVGCTINIRDFSEKKINLFGTDYETDEWTNITKNIQDKLGRNLLHTKYHPLYHLKNKIKHFFNQTYFSHSRTPMFSIYENFKPIVTVEQNFDRFKLCNSIFYQFFNLY